MRFAIASSITCNTYLLFVLFAVDFTLNVCITHGITVDIGYFQQLTPFLFRLTNIDTLAFFYNVCISVRCHGLVDISSFLFFIGQSCDVYIKIDVIY